MRGHKADRCWQKGKGEGGKGDWEKGDGGSKGKGGSKEKLSIPGHAWDNSWYHSNWHGKAVLSVQLVVSSQLQSIAKVVGFPVVVQKRLKS